MTDRHEQFVLAVDLGTGGPKVGLVSLAGAVVWHDHRPVETRLLPRGGAVQDAAQWWELVLDAARKGLEGASVDPSAVVAVACTGQWASTVPVDGDGLPVGECLLWLDARGAAHSRRVVGGPVAGYAPTAALRWVRRTGGLPSTSGTDPVGHILYLEHEEPAVAAATRWYLEPVDYLTMRFTGTAAASHASMVASWLTDNRRLGHLDYDPVLVGASGVPMAKLPPLRATGSVVGTVRADVAAELGLGPDVAVVTGVPDLHSAALGSGAVREYETHLAISTTSWISCPVPTKKTDPIRQIAAVPGLSTASYLVADNHETGGQCLQWLRDNVLAEPAVSFDELTDLAAGVAPGAGDVLFTPWLAGERSPVDDRDARGGFHNLSLRTTRADMVRAVLEGVAYNSRWLHEAVERFARRRLDPVRIIGGGAQSALWCQIHADVLGRTVERVVEPLNANLRGAALLAGVALGELTLGEVRDLVAVDAVFTPDGAAHAVYDRLYGEFPRLYRAQRRMFRRLNHR